MPPHGEAQGNNVQKAHFSGSEREDNPRPIRSQELSCDSGPAAIEDSIARRVSGRGSVNFGDATVRRPEKSRQRSRCADREQICAGAGLECLSLACRMNLASNRQAGDGKHQPDQTVRRLRQRFRMPVALVVAPRCSQPCYRHALDALLGWPVPQVRLPVLAECRPT